MSIHTKSLLKAVCFISLFCALSLLTHAQTTPTTAQLRPALQILDSTKEQDGLIGAVRRVKTEYARINLKEGQPVEGARQLLEITTYGMRGNRVDNVSYPISDSVSGREEYKYDSRGNIVEKILRDEHGAVLSREAYEYVFDKVGNWTKMVTNLVVIENGELKREPTEVTYRTLTYYAGDADPQVTQIARAKPTEDPVAPSTSTGEMRKTPAEVNERSQFASAPIAYTKAIPTQTNPSTQKNEQLSMENTSRSTVESGAGTRSVPQLSSESETTIANVNGTAEKPATQKPRELETTTGPALDTKSAKRATEPETTPNAGIETRSALMPTATEPETRSAATVETKSPDLPKRTKKAIDTNHSLQPEASNTTAADGGQPLANAVIIPPESTAPPSSTQKNFFEIYQSGLQKFNAGDVKGAIDLYLESIKLEPNSAELQMNLGQAYVTLKKDKEAMKAFTEAVRLNPELAEAFYGLGFSSFRANKYRDALDAFKKAVVLSPDMAKAHYGLAVVYIQLDKMDEMIQEYRIVQRLDSKLAAKLAKAFPDVDFSCKGTRYCR